jgi:putative sigma-54 modulation protein
MDAQTMSSSTNVTELLCRKRIQARAAETQFQRRAPSAGAGVEIAAIYSPTSTSLMAIPIQTTARHVEISDRVRQYAETRTQKLERFYDGIVEAHVILSKDNSPAEAKTAEINIDVYQKRLSAQDSADTYEQAINKSVDHLRRQLEKYKAQLRRTDKDAHR